MAASSPELCSICLGPLTEPVAGLPDTPKNRAVRDVHKPIHSSDGTEIHHKNHTVCLDRWVESQTPGLLKAGIGENGSFKCPHEGCSITVSVDVITRVPLQFWPILRYSYGGILGVLSAQRVAQLIIIHYESGLGLRQLRRSPMPTNNANVVDPLHQNSIELAALLGLWIVLNYLTIIIRIMSDADKGHRRYGGGDNVLIINDKSYNVPESMSSMILSAIESIDAYSKMPTNTRNLTRKGGKRRKAIKHNKYC